MHLIEKWLAGNRNFLVGAVLYKQFGTDEALKKLFAGKATPHIQKLLEESLLALLNKPKVVLQEPKTSDAAEMPKSTDPVLEALRNEWLTPYQKMNYLRHELDRYTDNTDEQIAIRRPICAQVLELEQLCLQLWAKRDHYIKNGQLPEAPAQKLAMPTDPMALAKLIDAVKRNIRRNHQLAAKHPDKPVYPQKAAQYEAELQSIITKTGTDAKGTEKQ